MNNLPLSAQRATNVFSGGARPPARPKPLLRGEGPSPGAAMNGVRRRSIVSDASWRADVAAPGDGRTPPNRYRATRPLLVLLWLFVGMAVAWAAPAQTNSAVKVGDVFPDLAKYELDGELPGSLKGKVVVVDFWASWCGQCQRTFPLMEELHHRYDKRGLLILAVNEDRSRAAMDEFLKEHPVTFTVVRDAKRKLAIKVGVPALPTSYLLDRKGRVRSIQPGARTARNSKEFIKEIEALLEENSKQP